MSYKIVFDENPRDQDIEILSNGLTQHAKLKKNQNPVSFFTYFLKNEQGEIVGGCNGEIYYGCLYLSQLWVSEELRGQGFGKQLMQQVTQHAKEKNCRFLTLETMDWQAFDFYKKLGFELEFERHGHDNNSVCYCMRKNI